jgi:hypothetical protein
VHGDSLDAEALAHPDDEAGALPAVGDEDGVEHAGDTSQVLLAVVALVVAVALGVATGGSLDRLGALTLRARGLVWGAVAAQAVGVIVGGPFYPVGLVVSALLVAGFLSRNRGLRGTGLLAVGLLANAVVVGVNGAMPVSVHAAGRAGTSTQDILTGADARHELADASTRLRWLGDVIPVPAPYRPEVVSPGDLAVAAGLAQLVLLGMGPGLRRSGRHGRG